MNCSAWADLHLLPQHRGVADLVMSSKLGGMLASGRPIVAAADPGSELFDVLTEVALLTPAGDDAALAAAIERATAADLSDRVENGLRLAESLSAAQLLARFERPAAGTASPTRGGVGGKLRGGTGLNERGNSPPTAVCVSSRPRMRRPAGSRGFSGGVAGEAFAGNGRAFGWTLGDSRLAARFWRRRGRDGRRAVADAVPPPLPSRARIAWPSRHARGRRAVFRARRAFARERGDWPGLSSRAGRLRPLDFRWRGGVKVTSAMAGYQS